MELLPLVCLCLLSCSGDGVKVVVEEDSDAVLPCLINPKEDISGKLFDWKKDGQKEVFMYEAGVHHSNILQGQHEQFKGRVSHFQDQLQNGNASIKITRTKMADSGIYSCDFPRHQPSQTFYIELVVDPVLRDRTGEKPGAAPEPCINIHHVKKDGVLLQCEAHGVSPLTVEWKDSDNNTLRNESTLKSENGSLSYITLDVTVTKTDDYRCVATQETLSHQIFAQTSVYIQGSNTGAIVGGVVGTFLITIVAGGVLLTVLRALGCITLNCKYNPGSRQDTANGPKDGLRDKMIKEQSEPV